MTNLQRKSINLHRDSLTINLFDYPLFSTMPLSYPSLKPSTHVYYHLGPGDESFFTIY